MWTIVYFVTCPVSVFLILLNTQFSRTNYKSKLIKAMFIHILIMTLKKLNYVYISVFFSDHNACLSLIKILLIRSYLYKINVPLEFYRLYSDVSLSLKRIINNLL